MFERFTVGIIAGVAVSIFLAGLAVQGVLWWLRKRGYDDTDLSGDTNV